MAFGKSEFREKYRNTYNSLELIKDNYRELDIEYQNLSEKIDKATKKLFNLKDMIYKSGTREINFDVQRLITEIIIILNKGSEE